MSPAEQRASCERCGVLLRLNAVCTRALGEMLLEPLSANLFLGNYQISWELVLLFFCYSEDWNFSDQTQNKNIFTCG